MVVYGFLFSWCLCVVFVSEWWQPHKENLGVLPPLQFLEQFEKDKYKFFFVCLELPSEAIQTFVCMKFFFLITNKIYFQWSVWSNYLFLPDSVLKACIFPKPCSFLLWVFNLFAYNWSWYSILFLYFCDISCYFYFFIY